MRKLGLFVSMVFCPTLALGLAACDKSSPSESAPSAAAAPTPTPTPTPAPTPTPSEAAPTPPKPKKTLADCATGPNVNVDNPAVEAELRKKLEKPTGALTKADLKRLKSLNLSQLKDIHELDPCLFTPMTGLKELFLGPGDYDDLSPLSGMTQLESLRASINQVKDLKPLEKLTKLDRLDLGRTQVSDLKPLAKLTSITELQLDDTPVEDLSPLSGLTNMENLSLKHTKVKDGSPLKGMKKLKFIYIGGSPLDDDPVSIQPLRGQGTKVISD
ncbi:MAG TPA: leucine-rich repeat domain-containing protein [Polyangiaceae bacterium]|nr:leucine-rich repeat domain-containing protein [Polyangiaceae bacterium]